MHATATSASQSSPEPGGRADRLACSRTVLALIWVAYCLPRALVLLIEVAPTSDAAWYYDRAVALAAGVGYSEDGALTAFWPPGQSMALGVVFGLFGPSTLAVGLFNFACGLLGGWLVLDLGRRIFRSELAARCGLILLACYPNSFGYFPLALTEVFYTTLLLACCWLLVARQSLTAISVCGVIVGFASLVKAQTIVVVPIIFAIGLLRQPGASRQIVATLGRMTLLLAVAASTVLPWTFRNHEVLGAWVPISTNGGLTLLTGNNDSARGDYSPDDPLVTRLRARDDLSEVEVDAEASRLAIDWIARHPGHFLGLMPRKFVRLWGPDGEAMWAYDAGAPAYAAHPGLFWAVRAANQAYYLALLAGFVGAFLVMMRRLWRQGRRWFGLVDWWLLPYGIAAYPTAIALVFSGQSRFHYPVMPFVCMACGWLLASAIARQEAKSDPVRDDRVAPHRIVTSR